MVDNADLIEDRRKCFQVDVRKDDASWSDDYLLRVTHNGNQWSSVRLNPEEIPKVIEALQKVLENERNG